MNLILIITIFTAMAAQTATVFGTEIAAGDGGGDEIPPKPFYKWIGPPANQQPAEPTPIGNQLPNNRPNTGYLYHIHIQGNNDGEGGGEPNYCYNIPEQGINRYRGILMNPLLKRGMFDLGTGRGFSGFQAMRGNYGLAFTGPGSHGK